jgi:O-acetyl-ADP-ribose deacetylase (regulator of RNase III)
MSLIHKTGNLITLAQEGHFDVIVQGCNCFCTMGGGIAREIREKYPLAASADGVTKSGDYTKLGTWTKFEVKDKFLIINAYTQYNMSTGDDVFEYTAFALILQKLAHEYRTARIGFPKIGCGLAGGIEARIMAMLRQFALQHAESGGTATVVEFAV